uniref:C-CAP/cofactor C-like domain-containing protein n=2 Tax=Parascaris univalens TaxID=6257 RepID=A0A915C4V9_PARUN
MYESVYFGTPKPFGQHSTAYRAVSGGAPVARPASSMAVLITPLPEKADETTSKDLALVLGGDRSAFTKTESDQRGFKNLTSSSVSQSGGNERWLQEGMPQKGRWNSSFAFLESAAEPKMSVQQSEAWTQGGTFKTQYQQVATEVPVARQVPIQFEGQSSTRQPLLERKVIPVRIEGASLTSVNPYHKEYQSSQHSGVRRPNSAVPFGEHASSNVMQISSGGDVCLEKEQAQPRDTDHSTDVAANTASEMSCFDRVQVFRGRQKPAEQPQRHNYTSLHYVPARPSFLQRRTSDSKLPSVDIASVATTVSSTAEQPDTPVTNAMVNVAKNVREELEHDPKFRQRAESMGERIRRAPTLTHHPPRQSPSLLQMESYFSNLQRHKSAMELSQTTVPLTASAQPFNADAVHNIFSGTTTESRDSDADASNAPSDTSHTPATSLSLPASSVLSSQAQTTFSAKTLCEPSRSTLRKTPHVCLNGFSVQSRQIRSAPTPPPKPQIHDDDINRDEEAAKTAIFTVKTANRSENIEKSDRTDKLSDDVSTTISGQTVFVIRPHSLKFATADEPTDVSTAQCASSPPGILLKTSPYSTPDTTVNKPQKRVVFQCDEQTMRKMGAGDCHSVTTTGGFSVQQELPPCVRQYDDTVEEPLQRFLRLSCDIGGDVKMMGEKVSSAFTQQRNFIWNAAGQKEPSATELTEKLSTLVKLLEEIGALKESKRNTPQFNHLSAVSEGIQALGWLTVKPTPAPFVKDMNDASMFYVNRVRNEHKNGDKIHLEWTKSWVDLLNSLQTYVRQVHTTGLVWNSNPGACAAVSAARGSSPQSASAPSAGAAPPPPPPPPVLPPDLLSTSGKSSSADRAALFAEINKGEDITKGLRKVTADMQTHKNPALRAQGQASGDITKCESKTTPSTAKKDEVVKPAKTWLENGKQWNVEYHKNNQNIIVEITDMKQTVYVFKCEGSVIQVKGKVNSITLDSCKKTSIVFDSLLSQVEVINCQGVQIQTLGAMPTLSIQKTDGCQVYLSKEAMGAEIVTSKSSEMNVLVPTDISGDFMEFPVPEQFKTVFDGKKLQTTVSDIV